ncbi:hypothetical protein EHRUM1_09110 [Ehrlichia ruminantium]|nr:hypothetical protein EHRUM1_09110 [Ehrlichia ruminantium]
MIVKISLRFTSYGFHNAPVTPIYSEFSRLQFNMLQIFKSLYYNTAFYAFIILFQLYFMCINVFVGVVCIIDV